MDLRTLIAILFVIFLQSSTLWAEESHPSSDSSSPLAKIDGIPISKEDVMKEATEALKEFRLRKLQTAAQQQEEMHQIIQKQLDQMISSHVMKLEAESRGMDTQRLIAEEVDAQIPEPTQESILQVYKANRNRLSGSEEQGKNQVRAYLKKQLRQKRYRTFMDSLRDKYRVEYFLEPHRAQIERDGRAFLGPTEAPVEIIEFSDFECSYCAKMVPTLKRLQQEYAEEVRLVYRHYPLRRIHPNAQKAAEASLCAGDQGQFWKMHDLLFGNPADLKVEAIKAKAGQLRLDLEDFQECLDSGRHADAVEEDLLAGSRAGVSATPTLFINGRRLSGAVSYQQLLDVVVEELNRSGGRQKTVQ